MFQRRHGSAVPDSMSQNARGVRGARRVLHFLHFHVVALHGPLGQEMLGAEALHLPCTCAEQHPLASASINIQDRTLLIYTELSQGIDDPNHLRNALYCAIEFGFPDDGAMPAWALPQWQTAPPSRRMSPSQKQLPCGHAPDPIAGPHAHRLLYPSSRKDRNISGMRS